MVDSSTARVFYGSTSALRHSSTAPFQHDLWRGRPAGFTESRCIHSGAPVPKWHRDVVSARLFRKSQRGVQTLDSIRNSSTPDELFPMV